MAELAPRVVLDSSACFALLENEPGAQEVEDFLLAARAGRIESHASFVTLTEVEYIIIQERNAADAVRAMVKMKAGRCGGTTQMKLCAAKPQS